MKTSLLSIVLILFFFAHAEAQISGAVYRLSSNTFAAIGSDPDN